MRPRQSAPASAKPDRIGTPTIGRVRSAGSGLLESRPVAPGGALSTRSTRPHSDCPPPPHGAIATIALPPSVSQRPVIGVAACAAAGTASRTRAGSRCRIVVSGWKLVTWAGVGEPPMTRARPVCRARIDPARCRVIPSIDTLRNIRLGKSKDGAAKAWRSQLARGMVNARVTSCGAALGSPSNRPDMM